MVITETTVGIGIHLEGVILAVGTGITVEALTMDQIRPMAQIRRMEAMEAILAVAMATVEEATMVMDSPTLVTTKRDPLTARTTFRPNSLPQIRLSHRTV